MTNQSIIPSNLTLPEALAMARWAESRCRAYARHVGVCDALMAESVIRLGPEAGRSIETLFVESKAELEARLATTITRE